MVRVIGIIIVILVFAGCASSAKDISHTLRYADGTIVGIHNVDYQDLQTRPKGEACTWNLLFAFPLFGDGSVITAANNGGVNDVDLVAETGVWFFPFNKNCTVVDGQAPGARKVYNHEVATPIVKTDRRYDSHRDSTRFFTGE